MFFLSLFVGYRDAYQKEKEEGQLIEEPEKNRLFLSVGFLFGK